MADNKKLIWIVVILAVVTIGVVGGSKFMVNKVADRVIEKLSRDYCPSPYGPGVDPDKVNPRVLESRVSNSSQQTPVNDWRTGWEVERFR